uniref:Uncharacterized protein n=1 Tax=Knipowitschia caucasica TaxID=637954 RepID=A0AAV2JYY1_KNICA
MHRSSLARLQTIDPGLPPPLWAASGLFEAGESALQVGFEKAPHPRPGARTDGGTWKSNTRKAPAKEDTEKNGRWCSTEKTPLLLRALKAVLIDSTAPQRATNQRCSGGRSERGTLLKQIFPVSRGHSQLLRVQVGKQQQQQQQRSQSTTTTTTLALLCG